MEAIQNEFFQRVEARIQSFFKEQESNRTLSYFYVPWFVESTDNAVVENEQTDSKRDDNVTRSLAFFQTPEFLQATWDRYRNAGFDVTDIRDVDNQDFTNLDGIDFFHRETNLRNDMRDARRRIRDVIRRFLTAEDSESDEDDYDFSEGDDEGDEGDDDEADEGDDDGNDNDNDKQDEPSVDKLDPLADKK
jgi:hypothetical protein